MKGSNDLVEQHLEQLWSDDRVVQHELTQQQIDDSHNMLVAHEDDRTDYIHDREAYRDRLDQYSTTT